jgi:hypothetical protein
MMTREELLILLKDYSPEEINQIEKDFRDISNLSFDSAKPATGQPVYLATAGAPGAAKSTTLEYYIRTNNLGHYVYTDPDEVVLKAMKYTYDKSLTLYELAQAPSNHAAFKKAYDKWRAASNNINNRIFALALGANNGANNEKKYNVAHGTTSTSPYIENLYTYLKAAGYRIVLLLCYNHEETRKKLNDNREREQAFVKVTADDMIKKGEDFSRRFDIYFKYADEILFYWNDKVEHGKFTQPCAKYVSDRPDASPLTVFNEAEWKCFYDKYMLDTGKLDIPRCTKFINLIPNNQQPFFSMRRASSISPHMTGRTVHGTTATSSVSTDESLVSLAPVHAKSI